MNRPRSEPQTDFYYLENRYYDPNTAQFLTPDPLNAITGSRYGYADNNPINGDDPNGLCSSHSGLLGAVRDTFCSGGNIVSGAVNYVDCAAHPFPGDSHCNQGKNVQVKEAGRMTKDSGILLYQHQVVGIQACPGTCGSIQEQGGNWSYTWGPDGVSTPSLFAGFSSSCPASGGSSSFGGGGGYVVGVWGQQSTDDQGNPSGSQGGLSVGFGHGVDMGGSFTHPLGHQSANCSCGN